VKIIRGANPSYTIAWTFFRLLYRGYCARKIYNAERVPTEGPLILAGNHASFVDPPLIGGSLPRLINYFGRESLFKYPLIGSLFRSWNAVPFDRTGKNPRGMKVVIDRVRDGAAIVLFPEGTRTVDGKLQSGKAGIGMLVVKTEAPVVPVRVFGTFEAFGRHITIPRPHPMAVKYDHPVMFKELRAEAKTCSRNRLKEIYQEVADQIMERISKLERCQDVSSFGRGR
jgi:1-acyl-sn-glycerol-3-phosphate acyltransferase